MTDFMTALPVILAQPTCPGDQRTKGVQFQSTQNLCRERHKTQVWLCFLVLSFLSMCTTCATSVQDIEEVQKCFKNLKQAIEKSDAMLYAPSTNDIKKNCEVTLLRCYMAELIMVIEEEEIKNHDTDCIMDFRDASLPPENNTVGCPPCEAYALKNITIFLEGLSTLLEVLNVKFKDS